MSERMTTIELEGTSGLSDWGNKTREEMIASYRKRAEYQKREAEKVLNASDDDFKVTQHNGVHVWRNKKEI